MFVRAADGLKRRKIWSTAAPWSGGDNSYDGVVTLGDFTALAANFGQTLGAELPRSSMGLTGAGGAVPEPTTAAAVLVAVSLFRRRRFRD